MKFNKILLLLLLLIITVGVVNAEDNSTYVESFINIDSNLGTDVVAISNNIHVIDNSNYADYFNATTGEMVENSNITNGDTIKIGNVSHKMFIIDKSVNITSCSDDVILKESAIRLVLGSDNSNITGLHFVNSYAYYSVNRAMQLVAILVIGTNNVKITNCNITSTSNNAIDLGNSTNCLIDNNYINCYKVITSSWGSGATPILIAGSSNNNITNNKIYCNKANIINFVHAVAEFNLMNKGLTSNENIIANNYFDAGEGISSSFSWGINVNGNIPTSNLTIVNNTICNTNTAINAKVTGSCLIKNNTIYNVMTGISVFGNGYNNLTITGNNISIPESNMAGSGINIGANIADIYYNIINVFQPYDYGIKCVGIDNIASFNIKYNNISSVDQYAMSVDRVTNTNITDNKLEAKFCGDASIEILGNNPNLQIKDNYPNLIFFVSPTGNGTGTNYISPTNLTYAFSHLKENITIYFKKGTYNITKTLNASNVIFEGEDAVTTILNGQGNIQIANLTNVSIISLTFNGKGSIINNGILNITSCIFNNTSEKGAIYNNKGKVNCSLSIFNNNEKAIVNNNGDVSAEYNWWGSNEKPTNSNLINCTVNNWIIMDVNFTAPTIIKLENRIRCSIDFDRYTNGTYNYTLNTGHIPNGYVVYINNNSYNLNNGKTSYQYIADNYGNFSIIVKCDDERVIYNFTVQKPSIIYISTNGTGLGNNKTDPTNLSNALSIIGYNDTLYLLNGTYKYGGCIDISVVLNIIGESRNGVILDGEKSYAILSSSRTLNLVNLTFINGYNYVYGGAIYNTQSDNEPSYILNCTFKENSADYGGGAISLSNCIIKDSTFINNIATDGEGGAIYCSGIIDISKCIFINNRALNSWGHGGAIRVSNIFYIKDSIFVNNSADGKGQVIQSVSRSISNISNCVIIMNNNKPAISDSYSKVIANNNWWGSNKGPEYETIDIDNWLVLNITNPEISNSTNLTVSFNVFNKTNNLTAIYNGSLPAREFAANSNTGTVSPVSGIIKDNVIINYVPDDIDDKNLVTINIDNQELTYSVNLEAIVINSTFFQFFDENGTLKSNFEILTFNGPFSNLGIDYITINKPVTLVGNETSLNNIGLNITSDNVLVKDFELNINSLESAVNVAGNNVTLTDNRINYNATKGKDGIAINAEEIANLTISNNNITYIGDTDGSSKNAVILMDEVENVVISRNKITGSLCSVPVNWKQVGSNWVSDAASLVISAKGSNIDIIGNDINTTCGEVSGSYDTIYGIQLGADNVNIKDNNLAFEGSEYLYATSISGKNITIDNNNITATAKSSHAYGMELTTMGGGEFSGVVSNNNVKVSAPVMAYGITSFGNVNATYDNNVIDVTANTTIGLEAQGIDENITNNKITANGNYVVGIGSASAGNLIISDNNVNIAGNGQGAKDTGDSMAVGNVGVYIKNNVENPIVSNNNITANIPSRSWTSQNAGLIVEASDALVNQNRIDVNAINQEGAYDSVYGAKITGDNTNVTNNIINVNGLNYTYGMAVGGKDVLVDGNNITSTCSGYYAGAINVYAPFKGNISNNNIKVDAKDVAYGIYDWGNVNSTYANNVIDASANSVYAIEACGNVQEILNNTINAKGNYTMGIAGSATGSLNIKDNDINIDGKGLGTPTAGDTIKSINAGIYLTSYVKSANVTDNVINANIATVPYGENGAALITESANTKIDNNKINATVSNSASDYNSFYGVKITGDNTTLNNNNISVTGEGYTYGVVASGEDISIDSNNIDVVNDKTYACGVNINAPFVGEISDNNITVKGKDSAYGIYTSQWGGNTIEGNYTNNNVNVTGKTAYAMELMGEKEIVDNNTINANGEYTMGIATSTKDIQITNNTILSNGTGKTSTTTYDMFGATNEGILIYDNKTNATIVDNDVKSTGNFAVNVLKSKNNKTTVTNNELVSSTNKGNGAINNINGVIANNTPVNTFVIISDDFTMYFKNGTRWEATLTNNGTPIVGADLTFTVNGVSYVKPTNENGTASLGIGLDAKTYDCVVSYKNGSDAVSKGVTITVLPTIYGNDTVLYYRNGTQYKALFVDGTGKPLNNTKVQFNINGVFYTKTTDENGIASITIMLYPKDYIITAISPNGEKQSNTITVLPTIVGNDVVKYFRNGTQYSVRVLDGQGNGVAGQKVTFNINGRFYTKISDENGTATLTIDLAAGNSVPKHYIITAMWGDAITSNNITVLPTITAQNLDVSVKPTPFYATVLDAQGKPESGVNVSFNINGKFYYRTTDADGKVALNISLNKGDYIITATRLDNNAAISNKIRVLV